MSQDNGLELKRFYRQLRQAVSSEEIFGQAEETDTVVLLEKVNAEFFRLAELTDANKYESGSELFELALEARMILVELKKNADQKIRLKEYGQQALASGSVEQKIETSKRTYLISGSSLNGEIATLWQGTCSASENDGSSGKVMVKIVDDPGDNDLLFNEVRILKYFEENPGRQSKHLPILLDEFQTADKRRGLVLRYIEGVTFNELRNKYTKGLDPEHGCWILARILSAIGFSHSHAIVHANLEPSHFLVIPEDHKVIIIDWSAGVFKPGQTNAQYRLVNEEYSAPQVADRCAPMPQADIYSLAKSMIFLLGGDIETDELPLEVDERLENFLMSMTLKSELSRPGDAWELYHRLDKLRREIYGEPVFKSLIL